MSPRAGTSLARSSGPRLGVARQQRVKTAGGRVGQWWTPPWLAALLVHWMGLDVPRSGRRWRVLDAGAGEGALSIAALDVVCDVVAVEVHDRLVTQLDERLGSRGLVVRQADFLAVDERQSLLDLGDQLRGFDVCLTNPPWEGNYVERFVLRALELAPRVGVICPLNLLCAGKRAPWWAAVEPVRAKALPVRPRFRGAQGGMRDVMLLEVQPRRPRGLPRPFVMEVG